MNSLFYVKGNFDRTVRRGASLVLCCLLILTAVAVACEGRDTSFSSNATEYIEPLVRVGLRLQDDDDYNKPYTLNAPVSGFQFGTLTLQDDFFTAIGTSHAEKLTASLDFGNYIDISTVSQGEQVYNDASSEGISFLNNLFSDNAPRPSYKTEKYYRIGPYQTIEELQAALESNIMDALAASTTTMEFVPITDGGLHYLRLYTLSIDGTDLPLTEDALDILKLIFADYQVQVEYHTACTYIVGPYNTEEAAMNVLSGDIVSDILTDLSCAMLASVASAEDGKYYIYVSALILSDESLEMGTERAEELVQNIFYSGHLKKVFSGYHNGNCFRMGPFSSIEEAEYLMENHIKHLFASSGVSATLSFCKSDDSSVLLTDEANAAIFSFSATDSALAMAVKTVKSEDVFLSVEEYRYIETIEFRRSYDSSLESSTLGVVTVLPLEQYVACVCGYEVFGSWPVGTQEAFAVLVRTYTIQNIEKGNKKHKSDFCDLCDTTCCQVYNGNARVTENIKAGVNSTSGLVLATDNQITSVNYFSVPGGTTITASDCWGGSTYDLLPKPSPWAQYKNYAPYTTTAEWQKEYTGVELYQKVKNRLKNIKGEITDVKITQYCTESDYVYKLTFTDIYGNTGTITNADTIRVTLGLNSACFSVGKNGETVTYPEYSLDCFPSIYSEGYSGYGEYCKTTDENIKVILGDGSLNSLRSFSSHSVLNAAGKIDLFDLFSVNLKVLTNANDITVNEQGLPDILNGKTVCNIRSITISGSEGKFIFVGKGRGHGVGVPQYAIWDLTKLGYDYETILKYYINNCELVNLNELGI